MRASFEMMETRILTIKGFSELKQLIVSEDQLFAVCDSNVLWCFRESHIDCPVFILDAGEETKTFETAVSICRWLICENADRGALLIAIGGGVTSDITGFAASIYKRGIRYANVPTTLLSQVDAGIGGKTGVNLDGLKNILGTFSQPEFTCICPAALRTLPRKEFISGSAELLKTFLLSSPADYEQSVRILSDIYSGRSEVDAISDSAQKAAEIKLDIVDSDPYDNGRRRLLNLGHTFGHALEWYAQKPESCLQISHGEAVAIGIIQAARTSEERGIAIPGLSARLIRDFASCGLPTELPCPAAALRPAIDQDKKITGGKRHMILLRDIGDPVIE